VRDVLNDEVKMTGTSTEAQVGSQEPRNNRAISTNEEAASPMADALRGHTVLEENVAAIKKWEDGLLLKRSPAERLSDWVTAAAASGPVLMTHVLWFVAWIAANVNLIPRVHPFDPFPFQLLTLTVSLEAIFLALFVLASQNRLARQSDKRAHLDLQIDLLAEREMTAVLQMLRDIAAHLNVSGALTDEQIRDLVTKTDLRSLTKKMDELADDGSTAGEQRTKN